MMARASHCVLLLTLAVTALGCNITPRGVHQVGNWGPVKVMEDGEIKMLFTKQLCENRGPMLVRIESLISYSAVLTERSTSWTHRGFDDRDANQLWTHAPPWRREENLTAVAHNLTADVPANVDRIMISIHDPVVVAVSDEQGEFSDGYFMLFHYASYWERKYKIRRLFVMRDWPEVVEQSGVPEVREIIVLPHPMNRDEVMDSRPWEPAPGAATQK